MSEQDSNIMDSIENGNSALSTTVVKRTAMELARNWPTVKEMESTLNCIICKSTPTYPVMQCGNGHIICLKEGQRYQKCPCGAVLFRLRLRWLQWMTENASYACPIKDCTETIVGQKDKGNHIFLNHDCGRYRDEELFGSVSPTIHNQAVSSEGSEETNSAEMFQLIEEKMCKDKNGIIESKLDIIDEGHKIEPQIIYEELETIKLLADSEKPYCATSPLTFSPF